MHGMYVWRFVLFFKVPFEKRREVFPLGIYVKGGFFSIDRFPQGGPTGLVPAFASPLGGGVPTDLSQIRCFSLGRFLKNIRSQCSQKKLLAR